MRAAVERGGKFVDGRRVGHGVGKDGTIVLIADEAANAEVIGLVFDKETESDTLNASADTVRAGDEFGHAKNSLCVLAFAQGRGGQQFPHFSLERFQVEWFYKQREAFIYDVALDYLTLIVSRHEEHWQARISGQKAINHHWATHSGHHHVSQKQSDRSLGLLKQLDGLITARGFQDLEAVSGQGLVNNIQNLGFVIYN
jgi:hypothetical protein